ncbi:MAG TPA: hypothetical protein VJA27_02540 [Patescibacteria group bacterium]|nr:hypothetical protein [Patescibacteria group bacterium]
MDKGIDGIVPRCICSVGGRDDERFYLALPSGEEGGGGAAPTVRLTGPFDKIDAEWPLETEPPPDRRGLMGIIGGPAD